MEKRDQTLIDDCLKGRMEAFAELIQPYQDRLFNVLYRLLGSREDAAEVLQETLIRAFSHLKSYQGESAFYTWLYRIGLNMAFSVKRRDHRRRNLGESAGAKEVEDRSYGTAPGNALENRERRRIVEEALSKIQDRHRAILILKDVDDLRYEEISEVLGIPIGTVRSRLHRARAEMREHLQPFFERGDL